MHRGGKILTFWRVANFQSVKNAVRLDHKFSFFEAEG